MRTRTILGSVVLAGMFLTPPTSLADERDRGLMPFPARIAWGQGSLSVAKQVSVAVDGHYEPRLDKAIGRFVSRLTRYSGRPIRRVAADSKKATLWIVCAGPGQTVQNPEEDERYALEVTSKQIRLEARTTVGVLRGLATLEQLAQPYDKGVTIPEVRIDDQPRFAWRGLLIDVCRHWQPISVIKRNLDAMAAVKLNVLHLHLTEDQGFRVESKRFTQLHEQGSDGNYFTQDELREIVAYARDRGIRVVPEFDMPGHTTSWLVGHPELAAGPGPFQIERRWGVFDPCFDPTNEKFYEFLDLFFAEMSEIFPDPYMHIGGDEVNGVQWKANSKIQAFMKTEKIANLHALQAYFNRRVAAILAKYGKTMIGWDEILGEGLPDKCVVQSWRGAESLTQAVNRGFDGILSSGFYLDHQRPASFHYANDPDPTGDAPTKQASARILGGEACMWAEFVTPETIDSRIWPRMAAIAERLWSPSSVNDVDDMYRRLGAVSKQLDRIGAKHLANYEPMLERLTGGKSTEALRTLADVVEPVKFYQRSSSRDYTSRTPLNRLVDAARPESETARTFRDRVRKYLDERSRESKQSDAIRNQLELWKANHLSLLPIIRSSKLLAEVEPVSKRLSELATLGLEAFDLLESDESMTSERRIQALEIIESASTPKAEVEVAILPEIRNLIQSIRSSH